MELACSVPEWKYKLDVGHEESASELREECTGASSPAVQQLSLCTMLQEVLPASPQVLPHGL